MYFSVARITHVVSISILLLVMELTAPRYLYAAQISVEPTKKVYEVLAQVSKGVFEFVKFDNVYTAASALCDAFDDEDNALDANFTGGFGEPSGDIPVALCAFYIEYDVYQYTQEVDFFGVSYECPDGYTQTGAYCYADGNVVIDKNIANTKVCPLGNPINPAFGDKYQIESDIISSSFSFIRFYSSSMASEINALGSKWRSSYHRSVSSLNSNSATVRRYDGKLIQFQRVNNDWVTDSDNYYRFEKLLDVNQVHVGWKYTENNNIEIYDVNGRLISITDVRGNSQTLTYNANEQLYQVNNNIGETITFTYDAFSRIVTMSDHIGRVWKYQYDTKNNLEFVLYPDATPLIDTDNPKKQYHYEDPLYPNALTGITDERGKRYANWEYDVNGNAISSYHGPKTSVLTDRIEGVSIVYNSDGSRIVTDSRGNNSTYNTVTQLGVALVTDISGPGCTTCGNGNTSYNYDPNNNNLLSKTVNGLTTTYGNYDSNGNSGFMIVADGTPKARRTDYTYDSRFFSKVLTKTEPSVYTSGSKTTSYTYDSFGNATQIKIDGFTPAGTPVSRTIDMLYNGPLKQLTQIDGPRPNTVVNDISTLSYYANDVAQGNNRGRLQSVTGATGILLRGNIQYTATGKVLSEIRQNGLFVSNAYYPGNDRLETRTETAGSLNRVTRWTYLDTGEVESITTADGTPDATTITLDYDDARRLTRITDGLGNYIKYTLDTEGNQTNESIYDISNVLQKSLTQTFDVYNRLDKSTQLNESLDYNFLPDGTLDTLVDGKSRTTQYSYDELKRLSNVTQDTGGTNPDTANVLTQYGYDVSDRLTSVTDPVQGQTTFVYDDLGNLLTETSPDTGNKNYTHDAAGNVLTLTDAKGQLFTYSYDALNRLTNIDAPGINDDTTYTYDTCTNGAGQLCDLTNPQSTTSYSYNGFGETTSHQGMTYSYDNAGRVKTMTYPSGAIVTYTYNTNGQINQVSLNQSGQQIILANNIAYTAFGPVNNLLYGNGKTLSQTLDQAYRLTQQNTVGVLQLDYNQYDAVGNLQTRVNTQTNTTSQFTYDELDRLDSVTGLFNQGYGYDRNGNRTTLSDGSLTDSFTYTPNSNRINTYNSINVTLDANGNTTGIRNLTLAYNSYNRLLDVNNGVTTYQYNGLGQRITKNTAGAPTPQPGQIGDANNDGLINAADRLSILNQILGINTAPGIADCNQDNNVNVLDLVCLNNLITTNNNTAPQTDTHYKYSLAGQLLGEYDTSNTALNEYIYLNGQPLAVINNNQLYYIHNDHLGTPQKLSNNTGAVVWSADYDPYGNATVNEDVDNNGSRVTFNLRFPGQYYDGETGLHYNYFRYYDPQTGRYITSDPIGLQGGLNTYGYVGGNPANRYDAKGLFWNCNTYDGVCKHYPDPAPHSSTNVAGGGAGGAFHFVAAGGSYNVYKVFNLQGDSCTYQSFCGRLGPGAYAGAGTMITGVITDSDIHDLDGMSGGIGGDVAFITNTLGGQVTGSPNGVSGTVSAVGIGMGFSLGLDVCYTKIISCNKKNPDSQGCTK